VQLFRKYVSDSTEPDRRKWGLISVSVPQTAGKVSSINGVSISELRTAYAAARLIIMQLELAA
jgi:hypothetical protein